MKLFRWKAGNKTLPGIIRGETYYDVAGLNEDYNEDFFETGGLKRLETFVAENKSALRKLEEPIGFASPIARPSKIVCIV